MSESLGMDILSIVTSLLPGFLCAWVFYGLCSHEKPPQFERIVQALVFTFLVRVLVIPVQWLLLFAGQWGAIRPWDDQADTLTSFFVALALGLALATTVNRGAFHTLMSKLGLSEKTPFPTEWFKTFKEEVHWVVLHLKDGRRLYGWPSIWPDYAGRGHFYLTIATWLMDTEVSGVTPHRIYGVLVEASDVRWVEFVPIISSPQATTG